LPTFSGEQLSNARIIAQVGQSLGASQRDIQIAIMAALQESGLRNLNYGDRDSIGLFQQRNAWGSREQRLDPAESARMFFEGGHQGQRGLFAFSNRDQYSLSQAAQKVQVSAFPDAYAKWEKDSTDILSSIGAGNSSDLKGTETIGSKTTFGADQPVQENGDLNLFAGDKPAGLDTPAAAGSEAVSGISTASAPGIEAGDQQPDMSALSDPMSMFDGMDTTTPTGGSTFEDLFPKTGTVGGKRERVMQLARQIIGTPYVWGGSDPDKGVDCSGFVQWVFKQIGVNLPRISAQQAQAGKRVGVDQLQPGDLVGWDNSARNSGADHIAIYLGNGQIIEAPRPGLGVRVRTLDDHEGDMWGVAMNY
jgi:cell wall-associated NlpC family hydrolase